MLLDSPSVIKKLPSSLISRAALHLLSPRGSIFHVSLVKIGMTVEKEEFKETEALHTKDLIYNQPHLQGDKYSVVKQ